MNLYDNKEFPQDSENKTLTCANNCRGVDPNAVVIGGGALLAATALGSLQLLPGVVGLAGTLAMGTAAMTILDNGCPSDMPCPVSKNRPWSIYSVLSGSRNKKPKKPKAFLLPPTWKGCSRVKCSMPSGSQP